MAAGLKALLAAAGTGSRLRPLTDVLPKCLMPINGKPLLGIWLDKLSRAGVSEIIINLHHHAELVRKFVERSPHARAVTLAYEESLLGTAGTLMHHRDRLSSGPIFFAHADNLAVLDMGRFVEAHRARPPEDVMTMTTFVTDAPGLCGIVRLDHRGRILEFHEKSPHAVGNVANAAVYMLEPEVFASIDKLHKPVADFSTDVLAKIFDRVHTFHNGVYHRDIGTLASLAQAQLDYFCAAGAGTGGQAADDQWYGMMSENGGALARDFAKAVEAAFADLGMRA